MQTWTIKNLLDWSINYFKQKKISQARLSSELLLGSALGLPRMQLYLNYNYVPTKKELKKFKQYILKRIENTPIQYILHEAHFRKIILYVDRNVLIPRPETELVVEKSMDVIKELSKGGQANILEVGIGSGAISLSIINELKDLDFKILATDNSSKAIEVAKKNAENILSAAQLQKISFKHCDIIPKESQKFDIVISNPPYIKEADYKNLDKEIKEYEPKQALLGGKTGTEAYNRILEKVKARLKKNYYIILEIDQGLSNDLSKLARKYLSSIDLTVEKDYNGRDRILVIKS